MSAQEYHRLIHMLDEQQQANISAHIYSSFLISNQKKTTNTTRAPNHKWKAWPTKNAPTPQIVDEEINLQNYFTKEEIEQLQCDEQLNARKAFLTVCNDVYKRIVYDKIHSEKRANLEVDLEADPQLEDEAEEVLLKLIDRYLLPTNFAKGLISWDQLELRGGALDRVGTLFESRTE